MNRRLLAATGQPASYTDALPKSSLPTIYSFLAKLESYFCERFAFDFSSVRVPVKVVVSFSQSISATYTEVGWSVAVTPSSLVGLKVMVFSSPYCLAVASIFSMKNFTGASRG